tara:strand:- start:145 stop:330 length:186 start_codon:yes stop_codon:yes gene_type:complete
MSNKKIIIKDLNNINVVIKDAKKFLEHIYEYHPSGASIHEEEGHLFLVDEKFRKSLKNLIS